MKKHFLFVLLNSLAIFSFAQPDTLTDTRDNKNYPLIKINNTVWMAKNLDYKTDSGTVCFNFNWDNCDKFGKLYNWKAANVACPDGWRLPSDKEFQDLISNFADANTAFEKLSSKNENLLNIELAGVCMYNNNHMFFPSCAAFWSSTINNNDDYSPNRPFALELFKHEQFGNSIEVNSNYLRGSFLYVRCVKR